MITIGATATGNADNINATAFSRMNAGKQNRFAENYKPPVENVMPAATASYADQFEPLYRANHMSPMSIMAGYPQDFSTFSPGGGGMGGTDIFFEAGSFST